MRRLRLILGDQLTPGVSSLKGVDKAKDLILMAEVRSEATYVKHHKKKIVFIFSAMRHFAQQLVANGFNVKYVKYDDPANQGSLFKEVKQCVTQESFEEVLVTEPGEYRLLSELETWQTELSCDVILLPDNRFLSSKENFADWAKDRKQLRMEYFYRQMRQQYGYLIEDGKPTGGKWNYDAANRRAIPKGLNLPQNDVFEPDAITCEVIDLVSKHFSDHFGVIDNFHFAVTRKHAKQVLTNFIEHRLPLFGDYQDAMKQGEPWLFHSHIGLYLNIGLLLPDEVIQAAQDAYYCQHAPLNAVEGFIRQILGWREFVRGLYWYLMPDYAKQNALNAKRPLPDFFWSGETKMNCLSQCVKETRDNAYAHHIQRLMVLGNFSLLAGLSPEQVNEWYLIVYADAFEWVEMPNVSGMVLFADGGKLASKPYAASGAYINKMSDYCKHCEYKVTEKNGEEACPFNYLYWDFLDRNQQILKGNPRLGMPYRTLEKMSEEKISAIRHDAQRFFASLAV